VRELLLDDDFPFSTLKRIPFKERTNQSTSIQTAGVVTKTPFKKVGAARYGWKPVSFGI
jgi:hypothetical protein